MKSTNWKNIVETIGIGAIVFSLIMVAYEVRQNTIATELEVAASYESSFSEMEFFIAGNPDFAELLAKGIDGVELNRTESLRLEMFYRRVLRSWQQLHYQYLSGALEESLWSGQQVGMVLTILSDKGLQASWKENRVRYSDDFNLMIESFLEKNSAE